MNTDKITWASLLASAVAAVCITLAPTAQAQNSLGQLFNGAINFSVGHTQQSAPQPSASGQLPNGLQPATAAPESVDSGPWPTKAEFLAATLNGDLTGITNIQGDEEFAPVLRSINHILRTEYGVPPLPRDRLGIWKLLKYRL